MTIQELIDKLNAIEDKNKRVVISMSPTRYPTTVIEIPDADMIIVTTD